MPTSITLQQPTIMRRIICQPSSFESTLEKVLAWAACFFINFFTLGYFYRKFKAELLSSPTTEPPLTVELTETIREALDTTPTLLIGCGFKEGDFQGKTGKVSAQWLTSNLPKIDDEDTVPKEFAEIASALPSISLNGEKQKDAESFKAALEDLDIPLRKALLILMNSQYVGLMLGGIITVPNYMKDEIIITTDTSSSAQVSYVYKFYDKNPLSSKKNKKHYLTLMVSFKCSYTDSKFSFTEPAYQFSDPQLGILSNMENIAPKKHVSFDLYRTGFKNRIFG